ncbi:MAG TPA: glycosyltransferase N-terminal domain-containing protein, partial [Chlamydiales bacterium]|nr:glycosyltransferase N-terminal domain-containing protein [Chlamydiales bacterium]
LPYLKNYDLIISSTTETGHQTAKKRFPDAQHIFLPFDFRWMQRKLFAQVKPILLLLTESDYWLNFIHEANCPVAIISGILSERSFNRHKRFPAFAQKLFAPVSLILVQNATYQARFAALGISSHVTGNLKFDLPAKKPTPEDFVITIGSTHAGEEALILDVLEPLTLRYPQLKLLVVPRHPERFEYVKKLVQTRAATAITQMGALTDCYAKSKLAICCGSFKGNIGGHNILEPVQLGVPVLFGPQMHAQQELVDLVTKANAGRQLQISELSNEVEAHLKDSNYHANLCQNAKALDQMLRGVAQKTIHQLIEAGLLPINAEGGRL